MSDNYWYPKDKEWMKARKELWRTIKYNLDLISKHVPLKRSAHKYHKELFFYGTINEGVWDSLTPYQPGDREHHINGMGAFWGILPVFRIWYHPQPESIDLDALRREYSSAGYLDSAQERFLKLRGAGGGAGYGGAFLPEYGMMGGREELVVRLLFPEFDYRKDREDSNIKTCNYLTPDRAYWSCISGTGFELRKDARFHPYNPGQYLWDHLAYAVEYYPDRVFIPENRYNKSLDARKMILINISEILSFDQRTDSSHNRPSTIAMVERLIGKYDRKEFPDAMMNLWDEAKADVSELQELARKHELFCASEDEIEDFFEYEGGFSPEKQREWIARWKQV